jgi:hypothetical protein
METECVNEGRGGGAGFPFVCSTWSSNLLCIFVSKLGGQGISWPTLGGDWTVLGNRLGLLTTTKPKCPPTWLKGVALGTYGNVCSPSLEEGGKSLFSFDGTEHSPPLPRAFWRHARGHPVSVRVTRSLSGSPGVDPPGSPPFSAARTTLPPVKCFCMPESSQRSSSSYLDECHTL